MKKALSIVFVLVLLVTCIGAMTAKISLAKIYRVDGDWNGKDASLTTTEYTDGGKKAGGFQFHVPHVYDAFSGELVKRGSTRL